MPGEAERVLVKQQLACWRALSATWAALILLTLAVVVSFLGGWGSLIALGVTVVFAAATVAAGILTWRSVRAGD